jgi:isochorismate hydrolase
MYREMPYAPESSALIVLDMQKYFLHDSSHAYVASASKMLPGLRELIDGYAHRGLPVFFTRHLNTPRDAGMMARWWRELITEQNPLSEITEALDTSKGIVVRKSQYDAFYGTDLEELLRKARAEQVVICGVMTHLCCESTARSAFARGFGVFFTIDGTATYDGGYHEAALLNLSHGVARTVLMSEILEALRARG